MERLEPAKRKEVRRLIRLLEDQDAFARLDAIQKLERMTQRTFDYQYDAPPEQRLTSVERWKEWIEQEESADDEEEEINLSKLFVYNPEKGAIQVTNLKALSKLIEKFKKAQLCNRCRRRPGEVLITEISKGEPSTVQICEHCYLELNI